MTSLRQRFIEDMQVRNFSLVTQASYTREVSGFARYFNKSPELLGPEQIRAYQIYLTNEKKLGVVSISVATSALRFLYRVTLKKNWCMADMIPAPKVPKKLPIILSPEEVVRFLDCVAMRKHRAILTTCYAAGLRISEAVVLTLPAIDSQRMGLACRARQRTERSLRDALTETVRDPAGLVANGKAWALALSGRYAGPTHHHGLGCADVPESPPPFQNS
jgi:integrase/recombinase XerD